MAKFDVQIAQGAEDDLEMLHEYLVRQHSLERATKVLDAILARIATLEEFPFRGTIPREAEVLGIDDFRQLVLPPYRLIYRVIGDVVVISLIADGRRDMRALFEERLLGR